MGTQVGGKLILLGGVQKEFTENMVSERSPGGLLEVSRRKELQAQNQNSVWFLWRPMERKLHVWSVHNSSQIAATL